MSLRKLTLSLILILSLISSIFTVAAAEKKILVKSIVISKTNITMYQNDIYNVPYKVTPSNADNKAVTFESLNEDIVYANPGGRLKSKNKKGTAKIRVRSDDGNATAYMTVTVLGYEEGDEKYVDTLAITHNGEYISSLTATAKDTIRLAIRYTPTNATDSSVKWSSDDKNVATVNKDGVVTCVGSGTCHITVKAADGGGASDRITLHVDPFVRYPTRISFTQSSRSYITGEKITFVPTFTPADTTVTTVYYTAIGPATIDQNGNAFLYDAGEVKFIMYNYIWQQAYETTINVKYSENHFTDFGNVPQGVKPDKAMKISFSAPVDFSQAASNIFASTDKSGNGKKIPIEIKQLSETVLSVSPSEKWNAGENYIFIKSMLPDTNGNQLGQSIRYTFNVRK